MEPGVDPELVAGRSCGSCIVCCIELTIDDPELRKLQGHRCHNALPDNGCAIYATRPRTCRIFYCGWRKLKWIREPLRPDRSGVLVQLNEVVSKTDQTPRPGVVFTLLTEAALDANGLAESVAASVAANVPTFLGRPGPPGQTSTRIRLNDALRDAVATRDKTRMLEILRRTHATMGSRPPEPIVLAPRTESGAP